MYDAVMINTIQLYIHLELDVFSYRRKNLTHTTVRKKYQKRRQSLLFLNNDHIIGKTLKYNI